MKSNFKENAYPVKALTLNNTGQLRHTFAWSMIADSAWTLRAKKWSRSLGLWGLGLGTCRGVLGALAQLLWHP